MSNTLTRLAVAMRRTEAYCRCRILLMFKTREYALVRSLIQVGITLHEAISIVVPVELRPARAFWGRIRLSNGWLASAFRLLMSNLKW